MVALARGDHAEPSVSFLKVVLDLTFAWLGSRDSFQVEGSVYNPLLDALSWLLEAN